MAGSSCSLADAGGHVTRANLVSVEQHRHDLHSSLPIYLNSDASLPLVASLMNGGMGPGAALAFLMTGAGTSVGAISGMLIIARWKVVTIVVASL
jgi:hypothetical protein